MSHPAGFPLVMPPAATQEGHPGLPADWLWPDFGPGVGACMTARSIGSDAAHSQPPFDGFNLGTHVGDDLVAVAANRAHLQAAVGIPALWLNQVHGNRVVQASATLARSGQVIDADGSYATEPGVVCTVMVADCLPVLLAAPDAKGVAALHAGWRGLAGAGAMGGHGILEAGVQALCEQTACSPSDLRAWLGPCIGPTQFEVGPDVLQGFGVDPQAAKSAGAPGFHFHRLGDDGRPRWWADLIWLARQRLATLGLTRVEYGPWCTASDASRFFSFRRDGVTGRQAACIWLR